MATQPKRLHAGSAQHLRETGHALVHADHSIVVFYSEGRFYAMDNRCPHMGYPLSQGSMKDGLLTCHWHNWQFEGGSGACLVGGADVEAYGVIEEDGELFVEVPPKPAELQRARSLDLLREGIERARTLQIARAVYALLRDEPESLPEILAVAAEYAATWRSEMTGGLVTLTAMTQIDQMVELPLEDRTLAIAKGIRAVAQAVATSPPRRFERPMPSPSADDATLGRWFRTFADDRARRGAEVTLLTLLQGDNASEKAGHALFAASTDHFFIGAGHVLDFANKAFELLDTIGHEHAATILPGLLEPLCSADRHEEDFEWKHPVDLVALLDGTFGQWPPEPGAGTAWDGVEPLAEAILSDDPHAIVAAITGALRSGASPQEAAKALALAAAIRLAQFHPRNEFFDWNTVHHSFSYANALHQAIRRFPSGELTRGVLHGAMYCYLIRFLNIPKAPLAHTKDPAKLPKADDANKLLERMREAIETKKMDLAGDCVYVYLTAGYPEADLLQTLVHTFLYEDHGFHPIQDFEAGLRMYFDFKGSEWAYIPLAGMARYLAAHSPTPRAVYQTVSNAIGLEQGRELHTDV